MGEKNYTACVVDEGKGMEQWRKDPARGKLEIMEKILYSASVSSISEYGAMEERSCEGKTELLEKNIKSVGGRWMDVAGAMME
jgi:hypothetical protein